MLSPLRHGTGGHSTATSIKNDVTGDFRYGGGNKCQVTARKSGLYGQFAALLACGDDIAIAFDQDMHPVRYHHCDPFAWAVTSSSPSSRSSAVETSSNVKPSCTIAKATSG